MNDITFEIRDVNIPVLTADSAGIAGDLVEQILNNIIPFTKEYCIYW